MNRFIEVTGKSKMVDEPAQEAERLRWMIAVYDRAGGRATFGAFFEQGRLVVAMPLVETAEGTKAVDVEALATKVAAAATDGFNEVLMSEVRARTAEEQLALVRETEVKPLREALEVAQVALSHLIQDCDVYTQAIPRVRDALDEIAAVLEKVKVKP